MALTPPSGCERQPTESQGMDDSGLLVYNLIWKGDYDTLKTWAEGQINAGVEIVDGLYAQTWQLDRTPGNTGLLTVACKEFTVSVGAIAPKLLKEKWELRSVRNDVSIFGYCGDSSSTAQRAELEAWMKEPDGKLAAAFKYANAVGKEVALENDTLRVAKKIAAGKEAVVRFYAALVRTRTYDTCPPACLENLARIDTPPSPGASAKAPNGIASAISARQWLKMQDDAIELPDGKWNRIEAWWGILLTEDANSSPWDQDFYGDNPWTMPLGGGGS